ncbi:MAG: extracellular solute-binding protein [Bacillota bacterium]|nr:MAG: iron ABC transporter substrate-binding protein [Bacillota bacterium]
MTLGASLGRRAAGVLLATLMASLALAGCGGRNPSGGSGEPGAQQAPAQTGENPASQTQPGTTGPIVIYSGRSEELIGPVLQRFTEATGIEVQVKYGDTAALAATILEEGDRTPADVFFAQDAGALGALAKAGRFARLPDDILNKVGPRFRSPEGYWVGTSGRARVVAYNVDRVDPAELPETIWGFTDPKWKGRIGWVPTNASFQAFVTALRVLEGDDKAREWLQGILKNEPRAYQNNTAALQAVADGEVDVAFINHYYLYRFLKEHGESFKARIHFMTGGDAGAMVNVAGVGVLKTTRHQEAALKLVEWLLSEEAQRMVVQENGEYPLIPGVEPPFDLPPLEELKTPDLDLSDLDSLEETLNLLREVGAL